MSAHEARLRELIEFMRADLPRAGAQAMESLDALLTEQRVTGLDDAIEFFREKQKGLDRQRTSAKSLSNAEIADMKTEAGRCGWAAQQIRMEQGRRKKGKEETG